MQALLIGINPPEKLKEEICKHKSEVKKLCGYQDEIDVTPHLTFVVNNFSDLNSMDGVLQGLVHDFSPFIVEVDGMGYFPQMKKRALYANVVNTPILEELQRRIVIDMAKIRHGCLLQEYMRNHNPDFKYTGKEAENVNKYGYPHVGEIWQPHITVSILDEPCFERIERKLLSEKIKDKFELGYITCFTYDNNWKPWKNYKLGI
jgi:hypothetical protein